MSNIILTDNMIINKTPSPCWSLDAKPFNTGISDGQNDKLHVSVRPRRPLNVAYLPFSNISYGGRQVVAKAKRETRVAAVAVTATGVDESIKAKAVITVKPSVVGFFPDLGFDRLRDTITDWCGKTLLLELVSAELDPKSGKKKDTIKAYAHLVNDGIAKEKYEAEFKIPPDFGEVGAILIENQHHKELYLANIVLDGLPFGPLRFPCYSWVRSKFVDPSQKRIVFNVKSYLPSQTPSGLKEWRESELETLRGNGQGERKAYERIYDYDTYNDLGDPDKDPDLLRPVLGGEDFPYPRRCRTGRAPCEKDPQSESRSSGSIYVPRDEKFSEIKEGLFLAKAAYSMLHGVVPGVEFLRNPDLSFPYFTEIDTLFNEGVDIAANNSDDILGRLLNTFNKGLEDLEAILRFEPPELLERDRFAWIRDEEFSRQTLAGLNPCSIKLLTEWPLLSKLDPKIYGPPESAITKELVEMTIGMSVEKAIEQKKLFLLDYHDAFSLYVHKVRELKGTTLYGSRTLFFLNPDGTLRPIAIELTRPQNDKKPQWKQVFTPSSEATSSWLWRLAKAHVLAHDSGYHQLISHWLRTHCCAEPYIIAANRQLSAMHPIYRLLHPHFRYTMDINARARQSLINAGGVIEGNFSPGKYSIEMSSVIYGLEWRFDHQSLPADLISRGMAIEDPSYPHGLKLTIDDYPFANDGLILWDSLKQWVTDYVNHYYPEPTLIQSDHELQAWWTEVRTKGHGDKKDEPWWPNLKTNQDLIEIITTIIWVTSGHHAAVNFGQYAYAAYFPNRPTIARTKIPTEDPSEEDMKHLLEKPEQVLLHCFPSQKQAVTVMAVLDVLSNHSADEQYIGEKLEPSWEAEPAIKAAFEVFQGRIKELEGIVDLRNLDSSLKNRNGAGIVPYQLLKPHSERGVTSMGVPNSISI